MNHVYQPLLHSEHPELEIPSLILSGGFGLRLLNNCVGVVGGGFAVPVVRGLRVSHFDFQCNHMLAPAPESTMLKFHKHLHCLLDFRFCCSVTF